MSVEIITPLTARKFISETTPDDVKMIINSLLAKGMNKYMSYAQIFEGELFEELKKIYGSADISRFMNITPILEEAGWSVTYHDSDSSFGRYSITPKK